MAWRFRRSTKIGPFRLTATKTGFSTSVGVPGARIGINSRGQVRRTVGLPGTGISDTEIVGHVGAGGDASTRSHQERGADPDPAPPSSPARMPRRWGAATWALFLAMGVTIVWLLVQLGSR